MTEWEFRRRSFLADYIGMVVVLSALIILFSMLSDHFFTVTTFVTIANQIPDLTVIAVGMTFVLIIAGIDLSVGSVMALSGAALGVAMVDYNWSLARAFVLSLGVGLCCGCASGWISQTWRIPSFIVSLGMLEIARGGAYLATNSTNKQNHISALGQVGFPACYRHRTLLPDGWRGLASGVCAGKPMVNRACGCQSSGKASARCTTSGQKSGAHIQHAPSPRSCAANSRFCPAMATLCTAILYSLCALFTSG